MTWSQISNFNGVFLSVTSTCIFHLGSICYLNNIVFPSRNYWLIVAQRKLDVLKTKTCPRSEASKASMLVLRTSNFWGATIRPIVPSHKHPIVLIVHHSSGARSKFYSEHQMTTEKNIFRKKYFSQNNFLLVYWKISTDDYYPSSMDRQCLSADKHYCIMSTKTEELERI